MRPKDRKKFACDIVDVESLTSAPHARERNSRKNSSNFHLCCSRTNKERERTFDRRHSAHRQLYALTDGDGHRGKPAKNLSNREACRHVGCHGKKCSDKTEKRVKSRSNISGCARARIFQPTIKSEPSEQRSRHKDLIINEIIQSDAAESKDDVRTLDRGMKVAEEIPPISRLASQNYRHKSIGYKCKKNIKFRQSNDQVLYNAMNRYIKRILLTSENSIINDMNYEPKLISDESVKRKRILETKTVKSSSSKTSGYNSMTEMATHTGIERVVYRETITTQTERDTRAVASQTASSISSESATQTTDKATRTVYTQTVESFTIDNAIQTPVKKCGKKIDAERRNNETEIDEKTLKDTPMILSLSHYLPSCPSPSLLPKPLSLIPPRNDKFDYRTPPSPSTVPLPTMLLWENYCSRYSDSTSKTSSLVPLSWLESDESIRPVNSCDIKVQCRKQNSVAHGLKWSQYVSHKLFRVFAKKRLKSESNSG